MAVDCSVSDCGRPVEAKGWCHAHYMRWYSTGDVQADKPLRRYLRGDPRSRFQSCIDHNGPVPAERPELGPCWIWTGAKNVNGYGVASVAGEPVLAYRWGFEQFAGQIPAGFEPDHLCRNRACVNYERHLELVTHQENVLRGESFAAHFARRTACGRGHEYTTENTYTCRDGSRGCRTCERARNRARYVRRMAAREAAPA